MDKPDQNFIIPQIRSGKSLAENKPHPYKIYTFKMMVATLLVTKNAYFKLQGKLDVSIVGQLRFL